jgi:hypothetical protein
MCNCKKHYNAGDCFCTVRRVVLCILTCIVPLTEVRSTGAPKKNLPKNQEVLKYSHEKQKNVIQLKAK